MRWGKCLLPVVALVAIAGCGGEGDKVTVYPVKGQVIVDGKPAAGVKVFFIPTSAPMIPKIPSNPHGVTGADGTFTLTTYEKDDGAAEGGYQVVLLWTPEGKEDEESGDVDKFLGWHNAVNSKLTARVKTGPNNLDPFKLPLMKHPPGFSEGVPGKN